MPERPAIPQHTSTFYIKRLYCLQTIKLLQLLVLSSCTHPSRKALSIIHCTVTIIQTYSQMIALTVSEAASLQIPDDVCLCMPVLTPVKKYWPYVSVYNFKYLISSHLISRQMIQTETGNHFETSHFVECVPCLLEHVSIHSHGCIQLFQTNVHFYDRSDTQEMLFFYQINTYLKGSEKNVI